MKNLKIKIIIPIVLFLLILIIVLSTALILNFNKTIITSNKAATVNPDSDFEFGMNYSHYAVSGKGATADELSLGPILFKYNQTGIREKVQSQMLENEKNGKRIRMLMWFMDAYTTETWGVLPSSTGKIIEPYRTNYINFLTDLKNYGFSTFYIGFGPTYTNSSDIAKFGNQNWSYIDDAITLAKQNGPKKIQVDLGNEIAMSPVSPWNITLYNSAVAYVQSIWPKYVAKYGPQDGTFSLHAKSIAPSNDPLLINRLIDTIKATNQPLPGFYDIHSYTGSSATIYDDIKSAFQSIRSYGLTSPLGIGEMYYNDNNNASGINKWMTENPGTIKFASPWMLKYNGGTAANAIAVNPPFTDSNLINTIGYKNTYGAISCNPTSVSLANGSTTSANIISSWSNITGPTNYTSEICVKVNNGTNTLMSRVGGITNAFVASPSWITSNSNYVFSLFDTDGNINLNCTGTVLSQCSVNTVSFTNTPSPTKTPIPTTKIIPITPTLTPTSIVIPTTGANVCLCQASNLCSNSCTFSSGNNNSGLSCATEIGTPTLEDKNNYCTREFRSKGDADGDGKINSIDYIYYVRAVNGGTIPTNINPDFNGDGHISVSDRAIVVQNIQR